MKLYNEKELIAVTKKKKPFKNCKNTQLQFVGSHSAI